MLVKKAGFFQDIGKRRSAVLFSSLVSKGLEAGSIGASGGAIIEPDESLGKNPFSKAKP